MNVGRHIVDDAGVDAHLVFDGAVPGLALVKGSQEHTYDARAGEEVELAQHDLRLHIVAIRPPEAKVWKIRYSVAVLQSIA